MAAALNGFDLHRVGDKVTRRLAEKDLARRGHLLELLGEPDGGAGGQRLTVRPITHYDLTRVYADADA